MTSKFSRFLNLERSRGDRPKPEEQPQLQSGNRFETLAQRGSAPQQSAVPETHLERFRGEAPLALVDAQPEQDAQLFPRCGSCESDNGRFAKECVVCGADLTTPQQRAYNERLWQTRKQELAQEREAVAALSQQKHAAERQEDQARYAQLLEKLRKKEGASAQWQSGGREGSLGLKLLSLISNQAVRWSILFGSIFIPLVLWRYGRGQVRFVGAMVLFVVVMLLLPAGSRRRGWWR
jgi:hypothetical protein